MSAYIYLTIRRRWLLLSLLPLDVAGIAKKMVCIFKQATSLKIFSAFEQLDFVDSNNLEAPLKF